LERRFVVREVPFDLAQFPHYHIEQAYIATSGDLEERVRLVDYAGRTSYYHTSKTGAGAVRSETTEVINKDRARGLLSKAGLPRIVKTRYLVPHVYWDTRGVLANCCLELDVYSVPPSSFCIAEIEFPTRETMCRFRRPDWVAEEVTEDAAYRNSSIARSGFPPTSP